MAWVSTSTWYDLTWSATTSLDIEWNRFTSVADGDGGIDFVLVVNDALPIRVIDAGSAGVRDPDDTTRP